MYEVGVSVWDAPISLTGLGAVNSTELVRQLLYVLLNDTSILALTNAQLLALNLTDLFAAAVIKIFLFMIMIYNDDNNNNNNGRLIRL